jgi:hypothetical protein
MTRGIDGSASLLEAEEISIIHKITKTYLLTGLFPLIVIARNVA